MQMGFRDYGKYDAVGLADLVRKKEVGAKELLDEAIARTATIDPEINAVVVKHYDYAEQQIARGLPQGSFTGVPFLLKDLELLRGTRTTFGASIFSNDVADHNSTLAQRFLKSGMTIFGKSSSPELGLMPTTEPRLFGPRATPGIPVIPAADRPAARLPRWPRASCRWRTPAMAAARSEFPPPPAACSE